MWCRRMLAYLLSESHNMEARIVEIGVTIICAIMASSGFWAMMQHIMNRNSSSNKLLLGIAHDRIMELGTKYVNRGYLTFDEYENLVVYLYEPYVECGGNGSAKHMIDRVKTLEINTGVGGVKNV